MRLSPDEQPSGDRGRKAWANLSGAVNSRAGLLSEDSPPHLPPPAPLWLGFSLTADHGPAIMPDASADTGETNGGCAGSP